MPHFVIDCSENIIRERSPQEIMQKVYDTAESTGLFAKGDIKVRINPFKYFNTGDNNPDFIHVFANIMEGRNTEQKSELSKKIVTVLKTMFIKTPIISMNIRDFEKSSYFNRHMLDRN